MKVRLLLRVVCGSCVASIAGAVMGDAAALEGFPSPPNLREAARFGLVYGLLGGIGLWMVAIRVKEGIRIPIVMAGVGGLALFSALVLFFLMRGIASV
ncbi:MAG: hypothetical protein KY476_06845 [Planctomycetes bacterium]|nr:hypothetical protein [Planctomycetota bacterium]